MQMYVDFYDREVEVDGENRTIGIILCRDKKETIARYTLPLYEFVEINPKVKLKKGVECPLLKWGLSFRGIIMFQLITTTPRSKNKYTMTASRLTNHEDHDSLP